MNRKQKEPESSAHLTAEERKRLQKRREFARKRRVHGIGYGLMGLAALMAIVHIIAHAGAFGGQPSGLTDLLAGYPMAGVLALAGVMAWGQ